MTRTFGVLSAIVCYTVAVSVNAAEYYQPVSLIQLVATPEKYSGQTVKIKGYFLFGTSAGIYLSQKSAEIGDVASAVQVVDQTPEGSLIQSCDKRYVMVSGRFVEFRNRFEITEVTEILDLEKTELCWEQ